MRISANSVKREAVSSLFQKYGQKAEKAVSLWQKKCLDTLGK